MTNTDDNKFETTIERMIEAFRGYSVEQYKQAISARAERFSSCELACLDTIYSAIHVDTTDTAAVGALYEAWEARSMECLEEANTEREMALWHYADGMVEASMGIDPDVIDVEAYREAAVRLGMHPKDSGQAPR